MAATDTPLNTPQDVIAFVKAMKSDVDAIGEKAVTSEHVATFQKGLDKISADVAAMKRERSNRKVLAGSDDDLREYCVVDRQDVREHGVITGTNKAFKASDGSRRHYMTSGTYEEATKSDAPVVRLYGYEHPTEGYQPGLVDDPQAKNLWQKRFQHAVTRRNMVKMWMGGRPTPKCDAAIRRLAACAPEPVRGAIQKTFTEATAYGTEWIDEGTVPELIREMEFLAQLSEAFASVEVDGSGSFRWPFLTRGLRPYLKSAPGAANLDPAQYAASALITAKRTFDPVTIAVRQLVYEDSAEDAFISAFEIGQMELAKAITEGIDDGIINADNAATHRDTISAWDIRGRWGSTGLGTDADHRKAWLGLRAYANDVSAEADGNGSQTGAGMAAMRALCDAEGAMGDGMFLWSPEFFLKKALTFSDFYTWEKAGSSAPILTGMMGLEAGGLPGQVGFLYGQPVVVNRFVPADLNASGVYDDTTKTKSVALYVIRSRFLMVNRRARRIEVGKDITRGVYNQVATVRTLFTPLDDPTDTTQKPVSAYYNLL